MSSADSKREQIEKLYGSEHIHGKWLWSMPDNQIHAIFGRMQHSGIFEESESLKDSYVSLFSNEHYIARRRANQMSIYELRDIIPKVIAEKEHKIAEGYQFTLDDYLAELQGKEINDGNSDETQGQE